MVVVYFEHGFENAAAAALRYYGVGVGEVPEEVADVGSYRESFEGSTAYSHIGLWDVAIARPAIRAVVYAVYERVAYIGIGQEPHATGHVSSQWKLHDDVVERPALAVFF